MDVTWTTVCAAVGLLCILYYCIRKLFDGGVCHSKARLDGRTVIVTGANTGIGKETAIDLAKRGAKVIIACRDQEKSATALKDIKDKAGSDLVFFKKLDLASLDSVRQFAASILSSEERLDILINNAGIMMCPKMLTADGFEMQLGVNHLGHFLLTNLLIDLLRKSSPSRIINLSSRGHEIGSINFNDLQSEKSYGRLSAYAQSKLANILFTKELHKRETGSGISMFAVHPGAVDTELGRHIFGSVLLNALFSPVNFLFVKTPWQGAQTSIYCAVQEGIEPYSGKYFSDCAVRKPSQAAEDEDAANRLWIISEKLVGLK